MFPAAAGSAPPPEGRGGPSARSGGGGVAEGEFPTSPWGPHPFPPPHPPHPPVGGFLPGFSGGGGSGSPKSAGGLLTLTPSKTRH
jgi:hypothetical protein